MARQTGLALQNLPVDAIYTSPLRRTFETATIVREALSSDRPIPTIATPCLREIEMPGWEGLGYREVRERYADDYRCWKEQPHNFQVDRGEMPYFPVRELYRRSRRFWLDTLPHRCGQTILIVGHSGTNRALIGTAVGQPAARYHALQQSNCGMSVLNFSPDLQFPARLEILNQTDRANEFLPKLKEGKQGLRLLLVSSASAGDRAGLQDLSDWLRAVSIDFCLSTHSPRSQQVGERLLQGDPAPLHLQVARGNFPALWQQTLATRAQTRSEASLTTGLVVAEPETLQGFLLPMLGPAKGTVVRPGALSVIHYPSQTRRPMPILQALNVRRSPVLAFEARSPVAARPAISRTI